MLELTVPNSSYFYYPNKCNLNVWLLFKICPPNNLKFYLASSRAPYSSKKELTLTLVSVTKTVIVYTRSLFGVMAAVFRNSFSSCQNISYDILWSFPYKFTVSLFSKRTQLSTKFIIKTRTNDITLFSTQPRSQSSSAISDVTLSVQLVGGIWLARIGLGTRLFLTERLSLNYRKSSKTKMSCWNGQS